MFPKVVPSPDVPETTVVGKPELKVDSIKLAKGNPAFTDDIDMRQMLYAKMLYSPHAHARIVSIDDSKALALPGVRAVLHHENVPRVRYASGGQTWPNPLPYDQVSFDNKVRHVGDRVAAVAAETIEIAEEAVSLIEVEYEVLPAVFDENEAVAEGAPVIHDEDEMDGAHDPSRNLVHHIKAENGDVEAGLAGASRVFEQTFRVHQVQQAPIEPHIAIAYWDSDERMVIRTSTQVPFHVRRMVAPLLGLPAKKIRIIKPRIGGGFGAKQEMLIEDIVGHLTMATGRPVRLELNRHEEFVSSRTRHPPDGHLPNRRRCDGSAGSSGHDGRGQHWGLWNPRSDGSNRQRLARPQLVQLPQQTLRLQGWRTPTSRCRAPTAVMELPKPYSPSKPTWKTSQPNWAWTASSSAG